MSGILPPLEIGCLKIPIPIIQGGMGVRVSGPRLAAAVSQNGGLGVIASVGLGEEGQYSGNYLARSVMGLRDMIREARAATSKPIGVNIMCALSNYGSLVSAALEEKASAIISGAGLPLNLPALAKNASAALIPIVSSGRAARIICKAWRNKHSRLPDAFIVEGPLAGGHIGFTMEDALAADKSKLERILAEVLLVARDFASPSGRPIPVVAAGGVFDGKDIARLMNLGASGVQMGTRFVCTDECDASQEFKEHYVKATPEDIIVIKSPVGMPLRVIRNAYVDKILGGGKSGFECKYHCLSSCDPLSSPFCIAKALVNAYRGDFSQGFAPCGSNASRIERIVPVRQLIEELVSQAEELLIPAKACSF